MPAGAPTLEAPLEVRVHCDRNQAWLNRRHMVAGLLAAASTGAACMPRSAGGPDHEGVLRARPAQAPVRRPAEAGLHRLSQPGPRDALIFVPSSYRPDGPAPLLLMLHGAGGTAQHSIDLGRPHAERTGCLLLAPSSVAATWDVIAGRAFGGDVIRIDQLLTRVFSDYAIDPARVGLGGFSDGASYALSLGLTNGELFRRILAFSPGFAAPARSEGRPTIFISHGVDDRVLPIDVCSRRMVPRLRAAGYEVDYREFTGGHVVPPQFAASAIDRFAQEG